MAEPVLTSAAMQTNPFWCDRHALSSYSPLPNGALSAG